jgi:tetratricopeptide (TPR) repeat protein
MACPSDTAIWTLLGLVAWALWVLLDFRAWTGFVRRHHQLGHEGRWDDLDVLFRRQARSFNPWLRLFLKVKAPGNFELLYANFLFQRGASDEALRLAEKAIEAAGRNVRMLGEGHALRALILADLGRHADAHAAAGRARALGATALADYNEALCCFYEGRLDEGLALARRAARDPKGDIARGLASAMLMLKGDDKAALEILLDRPLDVTTYYSEDQLRRLQRTGEGRLLLEAHQKLWAGVVEPLRYIYASYVYLELGDLDALGFSLEKAGAAMGGHPSLRIIHAELRACLCAGKGDAAGADDWLRKGADLLQPHRRRASQSEYHRFAGRAALMLGRKDAAVAELETALKTCLHPIENHSTRFWLARACEAAGNGTRAAELYRAVAEDGIPSKWSAEARAKASPPAPSGPTPAS